MSKKLNELEDGHYCANLKGVTKEEGKYTFYRFILFIEGVGSEEYYDHTELVTEKNSFFFYNRILVPLGLYASQKGLEQLEELEDVYIEFDKTTKLYKEKEYPEVTITPLFKLTNSRPVGVKNTDFDTLYAELDIPSDTGSETQSTSNSFASDNYEDDDFLPF